MNTTKRVKKRIQPQVIENKEIIKEVNETSILSISTKPTESIKSISIQTNQTEFTNDIKPENVITEEMLIKRNEEFITKIALRGKTAFERYIGEVVVFFEKPYLCLVNFQIKEIFVGRFMEEGGEKLVEINWA